MTRRVSRGLQRPHQPNLRLLLRSVFFSFYEPCQEEDLLAEKKMTKIRVLRALIRLSF